LLNNKQVASVIAGATSPEQVTDNAGAVGWTFSAEEQTELKALLS
jgi:aryl-alcohol dehydrogenase-like predicted oxidoreductase